MLFLKARLWCYCRHQLEVIGQAIRIPEVRDGSEEMYQENVVCTGNFAHIRFILISGVVYKGKTLGTIVVID